MQSCNFNKHLKFFFDTLRVDNMMGIIATTKINDNVFN